MKHADQLLAEYNERMRPKACSICKNRGFGINEAAIIFNCKCRGLDRLMREELRELAEALLDRADASQQARTVK